jgi:hypothetical protein
MHRQQQNSGAKSTYGVLTVYREFYRKLLLAAVFLGLRLFWASRQAVGFWDICGALVPGCLAKGLLKESRTRQPPVISWSDLTCSLWTRERHFRDQYLF